MSEHATIFFNRGRKLKRNLWVAHGSTPRILSNFSCRGSIYLLNSSLTKLIKEFEQISITATSL